MIVLAFTTELSQLQPNLFDDNAALLRALVYKIGNTIFGNTSTPPPWTGSPYAMSQVLLILYAGTVALSSSTILATIGDECFHFHTSVNKVGSAIERNENWQQGLGTSVAWYFDHSTELLPLTLHVGLLLLGCAFFRYLWESNITIISFFESLVSFAIFFYVFFEWTAPKRCPIYQTPCTNIIRHTSRHLLPALRSAPSSSIFIQTSFYCYAFAKWSFYVRSCCSADSFFNTLIFVFCPLPFVLLSHPYLLVQGMLPWTVALAYNRYIGTSPRTLALETNGLYFYGVSQTF